MSDDDLRDYIYKEDVEGMIKHIQKYKVNINEKLVRLGAFNGGLNSVQTKKLKKKVLVLWRNNRKVWIWRIWEFIFV
jgi:hypothetical protein